MNVELLKFIKDLQSEKKHDSLSEEATKLKFVLGALSHLGWSPFNLDEVYPEQDVGGGRVDYALRHKNTNKVFIEAKKIGEPLEKHQEQLLSYSFKSGVKIAVLTNGITWWFYLPLHEGDWEQRRFYTIEIHDQNAEDIVDRFEDFISQKNVISGKANDNAESIYKSKQRNDLIKGTLPKAWEKLISEPDELLVELISETTEKLCGFRPEDKAVEKFIARELKRGTVIIKPKSVKPKHTVTISTGSSRRKWDKFLFFEELGKNVDEQLFDAIQKVYNFCETSGCSIKWGTGAISGSFGLVCDSISQKSIFTAWTSRGNVSLNFGWLHGSDYADKFKEDFRNLLNRRMGLDIEENPKFPSIVGPVVSEKVDAFIEILKELLSINKPI